MRFGRQDRTVQHLRVHLVNVRKAREKKPKRDEEIQAEEELIAKFETKLADGTALSVFEDVHDREGNKIGEQVVRTCGAEENNPNG